VALNSLYYADVPLGNYSLTHSRTDVWVDVFVCRVDMSVLLCL